MADPIHDPNDPRRHDRGPLGLYDDFAGGERLVRAPMPFFAQMKEMRARLGKGRVHPHFNACGHHHG